MKYFRMFFTSYDCRRLILNTLHIGFIKCILEFPFAIILALLLNEMRALRYKKLTQTILNQIIGRFGGDSSTFYLMKAEYFHRTLFLMDIWRNIGWDSIIYLGAIAAVDQELYEAANIDGCNRLGQIWHVTLPGIRSTIGLLFIMGVGGLLSSGFEQMWLLRTPGNMSVADTLDVWVVRIGLQKGQFGYASSVGLVQGVVGLVLVVTANTICKKSTEVGLW